MTCAPQLRRALSALAALAWLVALPSVAAAKGKKAPPPAPSVVAPEPPPPPPPEVADEPWRNDRPGPGPESPFVPPAVERFTLRNGLEVLLSTRRGLPIVAGQVLVRVGTSADPPGREGMASLAASMLDEGTKSLDALALSDRLKRIATDVAVSADLNATTLYFDALSDQLDPTFEVLAEMITAPSFPDKELDRVRKLLQADVVARRSRPAAVAHDVFRRALFGDRFAGRPGGGTEEGLARVTRADLARFHKTWFVPNNAVLVVAGDVDRAALQAVLDRRLAGWKKRKVPAADAPSPPPVGGRRLWLVDKPGATQSQVIAGNIGISRLSPGYIPALVLNAAFGGQFASRVNLNLREAKGYTYGARSGLDFWRSTGAWSVSAPVKADTTAATVTEILKEIEDIAGARPLDVAERDAAASALVRSYPSNFGDLSSVAGRMTPIGYWNLPDTWLKDYPVLLSEVDAAAANAVAREVIRPQDLVLVVVGDRATVEAPLRALGLPIEVVDERGVPVAASSGTPAPQP